MGLILDSEKDIEESKLHVPGGLNVKGRFSVTENQADETTDQDTKLVSVFNFFVLAWSLLSGRIYGIYLLPIRWMN